MNQRRIVLIGAGGQLASDLVRPLQADVIALSHRELEITDAAAVFQRLDASRPQIVINTAGYNLVDQAEEDPAAAFSVNAFGVRNVAQWCGRHGVPLVHISTDYVFGGDECRARPYEEDDRPQPVSVYGESKLSGEHFVQAYCEKHFVVRTCGLYGVAATKAKGNFIETMLRLGATRPHLRVVNDQRCTPSYTEDVAGAIARLFETTNYGLYHVTNSGSMTWYELACEVFRQSKIGVEVTPITSAEFGAKARRPGYSVLNCSKAENLTGRKMPEWKDAVSRYLAARPSA